MWSLPPNAWGMGVAMATKDLTSVTDGWPYVPGQISVRRVRGTDNRIKLQMRVDLGVLQMEVKGRPDGVRPHGCESVLDYQRGRVKAYRRQNGNDLGFGLDAQECRELRDEALQYYQRYVASFVLEDYESVARDTRRNLGALDLCATYATDDSDRFAMEGYRPYIIMMHCQSLALLELRRGEANAALAHVRHGLAAIRRCYRQVGEGKSYRKSAEYQVLVSLRGQILRHLPPDPARELRKQLRVALAEERYEEAARLRDQLSRLRESPGTTDAEHTAEA